MSATAHATKLILLPPLIKDSFWPPLFPSTPVFLSNPIHSFIQSRTLPP